MFNGIEIILGMICSVLGIALGYVTILGVTVGIKLAIKRSIGRSEEIAGNLDPTQVFN